MLTPLSVSHGRQPPQFPVMVLCFIQSCRLAGRKPSSVVADCDRSLVPGPAGVGVTGLGAGLMVRTRFLALLFCGRDCGFADPAVPSVVPVDEVWACASPDISVTPEVMAQTSPRDVTHCLANTCIILTAVNRAPLSVRANGQVHFPGRAYFMINNDC